MMIESALTLNAIVTNYRRNSSCDDTTFEMMLEHWAEHVFAEEVRPIDYGLPSGICTVDGESQEEIEAELIGFPASDTRPWLEGHHPCERPLNGHSTGAACAACNGTGERLGILPWRSYPCRTCGGRGSVPH